MDHSSYEDSSEGGDSADQLSAGMGGNVTLSDPVLFLAEEKKNEYIWISSSKIIDYMLKYRQYVWRKE